MGKLLRYAIDAVIDSRHTGRLTFNEIEKTEKTYLGTKIEILLRHYLKAARGTKLDLSLDGIEVDIKNTIGGQWTIPPEACGHPCILIRSDENKAIFSIGLIYVSLEHLNPGKNRDAKSTISKVGRKTILWLVQDAKYPPNFWQSVEPQLRKNILEAGSGTARLAALFTHVQRQPLTRTVVESLAQQKDSLKRLRKNGGARDLLDRKGVALLWGQKDKALIQALGLPVCSRDEFISISPQSDREREILRNAGRLS